MSTITMWRAVFVLCIILSVRMAVETGLMALQIALLMGWI